MAAAATPWPTWHCSSMGGERCGRKPWLQDHTGWLPCGHADRLAGSREVRVHVRLLHRAVRCAAGLCGHTSGPSGCPNIGLAASPTLNIHHRLSVQPVTQQQWEFVLGLEEEQQAGDG